MTKWQRLTIGGCLGIAGVITALFFTNPQRSAYEDYVVERIGLWAQQECRSASTNAIGSLANITCRTLVTAGQPYLREMLKPVIANHTSSYNWGIVSFYTTEVTIPQLNFTGRIETIGILDQFFTYRMP